MINQLNNYFSAEKQESVIFITVGMVAIGVSAWLWMNGHRPPARNRGLASTPAGQL
jgi:hypothetical protein